MKSLPRSINNSGLKSVGRTSVFLVMVPGLLCSQWELPHVRMEPWPEQSQPGHELLSTVFLRSVGVVAKKERKESWSSCLYIQF